MRIKLAVAVIGLTTLGAVGAYAQGFSQDFSAVVTPNPIVYPPGTLPVADQPFDVTITNLNLSVAEQFDSDSIGALPATVNLIPNSDQIYNYIANNGPVTLAPGASLIFGPGGVATDAFDLSIGAGTDNFVGDFTVNNSGTGDSNNYWGCGPGNSGNVNCPSAIDTYIDAGNPYGNFQVTTVPEPTGISLLASGVFSSALLLRRRRR